MESSVRLRAMVFDVYGTLFDVHSIRMACESSFPGHGAELSRLWRTKQLEYTWLRSLMGRYEKFEDITRDALGVACRALGLQLAHSDADLLMEGYRWLSPFPEVKAALAALDGRKRAILSNGSPDMLMALIEHAGLSQAFDAVISVDELKVFKPHPSVYSLALRRLGVHISDVGFVSSNFWDIAGATSFGLRTFWINRNSSQADELGFRPQAIIADLAQLAELINRGNG
jgi:2-haloacid dehalogenase